MSEFSILVVEDEQTLRRLLAYRLGKQYRVRTAANGIEAIELIQEEQPDLIVSDIMMPEMDGYALLRSLQKDEATRSIPFIFLTAKSDENAKLEGMRSGVDDYITKPFDIDQLITRIARLLERKHIFQTQLNARIGEDFSRKLLPRSLPEIDNYRLFFYNKPREYGGGDLFDWTHIDEETYLFTIGDVMGKGLQAKFYAFSFLSYIRGLIHAMRRITTSPAQLLTQLNQMLLDDDVLSDTFVTLLLLRWEPRKNRITYANAGHCRPILVGKEESKPLMEGDTLLGLTPDVVYQDIELYIQPQQALLSYTDALIEQRAKPTGEMMGEKTLLEESKGLLGLEDPIETFLNRLLRHSLDPEFTDDILVFWLERLS